MKFSILDNTFLFFHWHQRFNDFQSPSNFRENIRNIHFRIKKRKMTDKNLLRNHDLGTCYRYGWMNWKFPTFRNRVGFKELENSLLFDRQYLFEKKIQWTGIFFFLNYNLRLRDRWSDFYSIPNDGILSTLIKIFEGERMKLIPSIIVWFDYLFIDPIPLSLIELISLMILLISFVYFIILQFRINRLLLKKDGTIQDDLVYLGDHDDQLRECELLASVE